MQYEHIRQPSRVETFRHCKEWVLKTPNVGSPTVNNVGPLSKTNFCEKEA